VGAEGLLDLAGGLLEDPRQHVLLPVGDSAELATGADRPEEVLHDTRGERLERGLGVLPASGCRRSGSYRGHGRPQARGRAPQLPHRTLVPEGLGPV
jgi:hypothetical protein